MVSDLKLLKCDINRISLSVSSSMMKSYDTYRIVCDAARLAATQSLLPGGHLRTPGEHGNIITLLINTNDYEQ